MTTPTIPPEAMRREAEPVLYDCARRAERAGMLLHECALMARKDADYSATYTQAVDMLNDAIRLLTVRRGEANKADHTGDNCVACRCADAGLNELGGKHNA